MKHCFVALQFIFFLGIPVGQVSSQDVITLARQNEVLFRQLQEVHNLTEEQITKVRAIFAGSSSKS